jgi:hypothetical protein
MISIQNCKNFKGWLNISIGGILFDQTKSRAKAIKIAKSLCESREENAFSFNGFPMLKEDC